MTYYGERYIVILCLHAHLSRFFQVEQCFSLYATSYAIAYKDDDGEITNISTDDDLVEAIQYFQAGDDAPLSSAASILSGRSFGARKITLRVNITVDYDGPSLSDTSSLASLDDFKRENGSQQSFSFGTPSVDLDDDSVTVSSRDPGTSSARNGIIGRTLGQSLHSISKQRSFVSSDNKATSRGGKDNSGSGLTQESSWVLEGGSGHGHEGSAHSDLAAAAERYPADPSAVFERLKLSETLRDDASSVDFDSLAASERGAAWLRDQNQRTIRSMLGALPAPSDSDSFSLSLGSQDEPDPIGGDLALERDPRGKYYYTYTSGSSQFPGSMDDEGQMGNPDGEAFSHYRNSLDMKGPRPTSMQLNWLAAQQLETRQNKYMSTDVQSISIPEETPQDIYTIDKDLLPFLPVPGPPPEILTDCSGCGVLLDSIRYICSTCGEKAPVQASGPSFSSDKGKDKDSSPISPHSYPPPGHSIFSSPNSSSSQTYIGSPDTLYDTNRHKPLPSIPSDCPLPKLNSIFRKHLSVPGSPSSPTSFGGYELCSMCLEGVGVHHAIEAGLAAPGSSPVLSTMSPAHDDPQRASQWRRAAPKKGQLRHAYQEKVWGHHGWEDVGTSAFTPRYLCANVFAQSWTRHKYRNAPHALRSQNESDINALLVQRCSCAELAIARFMNYIRRMHSVLFLISLSRLSAMRII